ncbi:hypothetical protein JCM3774_002799 [Rhodotorula dairenensis]
MSAAGHIPLFHFSQLSLSHPPAAFLAPSELTPSPTPFDLAAPLASLPSAAPQPDRPLFLGIDSAVDRIKACVLDSELRAVWTAKVDIDQELREYGTRDGVRTRGDSVTCPSVVRLHALDLLLTKLSRDCPDPSLLSRIACISGAGQPNALHYLAPTFSHVLRAMTFSPHLSLSELFTPVPPSNPLFTVAEPTTDGDASTVDQIRTLEAHFGQDQFDTSTRPRDGPDAARRVNDAIEKGREELARRTGGRPCLRNPVAQLRKILEDDKARVDEEKEFVRNPNRLGKLGLLDRTERIVLESGLLASVLLGRLAPLDISDACTTDMFDPLRGEWDADILEFVVGEEGPAGARKLEALFGELGSDGGKSLGTISPYFVKRFGFSPACLISPFTGAEAATALAYPLSARRGDVLVSLCGVAETDSLIAPVSASHYTPSLDWSLIRSPVRTSWEDQAPASGVRAVKERGALTQHGDDDDDDDEQSEEDSAFFAIVQNRDAGIGRALVRDLYCNGKWDVFAHFSAISPHGGTNGIDEKYFAYFFPHREASLAQGFLRFVAGARAPEFSDRKVNPRLLLESQAMTLRIALGRLLRAMQSPAERARDGIRPFDAVGFPALSPATTAKRLILVGEAAPNSAIASVVSSVFSAPAFLPAPLAGTPSATGQTPLAFETTAPAALGTAYKAAWTFHRAVTDERISFHEFLRRSIEATSRVDARALSSGDADGGSAPSQAGTFASSSALSGPALSLLSLGGPDRSHISTAGSSMRSPKQAHEDYKPAYDEPELLSGGREEVSDVARRAELTLPGLKFVAEPNPDLHKYYASMLPEFVRLKRCALKGLI